MEAKRNLVTQLRMNVEFLEGCLQKYKKFCGSDVNICEAIDLTLNFVQNQGFDTLPAVPEGFKLLNKVKVHLPLK